MAKRKRLTPAQPGYLDAHADVQRIQKPAGLSPAPIAQVAGEASATAALGELSALIATARSEGRMIEPLPLDEIDTGYLVRDRLMRDDDDMAALMASIEARGQQTPIEVIAYKEPKKGFNYGLISGWRRLTALNRLHTIHEGGRFATVLARLVEPETAQAAYVAMVEENEIRANLSHYERARITLRAYHEGVYPTKKAALQGLFDAVSRSKRSKINSFIPLVENLDRLLKFPTAIPEKLGLELSRRLQEDHRFISVLYGKLQARPATSPEAELGRLSKALGRPSPEDRYFEQPVDRRSAPAAGRGKRNSAQAQLKDTVSLNYDPEAGRIELTGAGVGPDLFGALEKWLKTR